MKQLFIVLVAISTTLNTIAQDKSPRVMPASKPELPPIGKYILATQDNLALYKQNLSSHSSEHDVNSIIKDIETYLNALPKTKSTSDQLLSRQFNALRHFFLTTTNKTSVAAGFLYSVNPYQFCSYNDTATALYIFALNDGVTYNLEKITEKKVIRNALEQCLLPSLNALDEFKDNEIKYIGMSVYYGGKDTRDGAPKDHISSYCLTLVARLTDLQQFASGLITEKGLLAGSELYISDGLENNELNRIRINVE
jgi:hypothetical protein